MTQLVWPHLDAAPEGFYEDSLGPARALWLAWRVPSAVGSGRPAGPRGWQWSAMVILAVAALEAGLEELLLAGHARRSSLEGTTLVRDERRHLVEDLLQAPNGRKIARAMFSSFGVRADDVSPWPASSHFTARKKLESSRGSGRGSSTPGPMTWTDLSKWLDTVTFVRNAVAHGDVAKTTNNPAAGEGVLWVRLQNGRWSLQQPHALTSLRVVVATYNHVATALHGQFGSPSLTSLRRPDDVFGYPA